MSVFTSEWIGEFFPDIFEFWECCKAFVFEGFAAFWACIEHGLFFFEFSSQIYDHVDYTNHIEERHKAFADE